MSAQQVNDVPGVVTTNTSRGFWVQDAQPDADPDTSEGIFVFTSSTPTVSVADSVTVIGTVNEFRPGGGSGTDNLTTTEITSPAMGVDLPVGVAGPARRGDPAATSARY